MTDQQRMERARLAQQSLEFLDDAFGAVASAYSARLQDIASKAPWEANKITALANAIRIAAEVRGQIEAIVHDGVDAARNIDRAKRIEKLSPAARRLLDIGVF